MHAGLSDVFIPVRNNDRRFISSYSAHWYFSVPFSFRSSLLLFASSRSIYLLWLQFRAIDVYNTRLSNAAGRCVCSVSDICRATRVEWTGAIDYTPGQSGRRRENRQLVHWRMDDRGWSAESAHSHKHTHTYTHIHTYGPG